MHLSGENQNMNSTINRPNFFIVGAPKCATTSMANYLREHPDTFVPRGEPHFFGSDISFNTPPISEDEYLNLFERANKEKCIGEKSSVFS